VGTPEVLAAVAAGVRRLFVPTDRYVTGEATAMAERHGIQIERV
jgi:hypothetical protein